MEGPATWAWPIGRFLEIDMRLDIRELALSDVDLFRMLEWLTSKRADLKLQSAEFTPQGVTTKGTLKSPLGALSYEMVWGLSLEGGVVISKLSNLKLGQSLPIPFLKSIVMEQIYSLLKGLPGVESKGDCIRITGKQVLESQGASLTSELVSLELTHGELRAGFE